MIPTKAQRPLFHPRPAGPVFAFIAILFMLLLFLEALGALCLLVFIVWWTMFSGRDKGELPQDRAQKSDQPPPPPPPGSGSP